MGPTPEKGPAGIQERLRGTVPWSRLGNPDPTGGSGVGGRGAYDVSEVSCLDSLGLLYPRLVSSPDAGSPTKRVASGRWPPAAEEERGELSRGLTFTHVTLGRPQSCDHT